MDLDKDNMRTDLKVLGRNIGTYEYWEQADTATFQFYNYIPREGVNLPKTECLTVDYISGICSDFVESNSDDNKINYILREYDLVKLISHIPLGE